MAAGPEFLTLSKYASSTPLSSPPGADSTECATAACAKLPSRCHGPDWRALLRASTDA